MNTLLQALEERGIEIVEGKCAVIKFEPKPVVVKEADAFGVTPELPKLSDDPIRMYLSQMAEIPLLSRERRNLAGQEDRTHPQAFPPQLLVRASTLRMQPRSRRWSGVHKGELPFDRTIKVSLTERLDQRADPGPHAAQPADARHC